MTIQRTIYHLCPVCNSDLCAAFGGEEAPKPGDHTVCAHCRTLLKIEHNGYRLVPDSELATMPADFRTQIERIKKALGVLTQ